LIVKVITLSFTTTPSEVLRSYRACHPWGLRSRWFLTVVLILEGLWVGSPVLVVAGLAYFAYATYGVRRQLRRFLHGEQDVTVSISDDSYTVTGPSGTTIRPWSAFQNVRQRGEFWVLRLSWSRAMALPTAALDPQQTAALEQHLRTIGLLPA
jgi:hypothetical protein